MIKPEYIDVVLDAKTLQYDAKLGKWLMANNYICNCPNCLFVRFVRNFVGAIYVLFGKATPYRYHSNKIKI